MEIQRFKINKDLFKEYTIRIEKLLNGCYNYYPFCVKEMKEGLLINLDETVFQSRLIPRIRLL